MLERQTVFRVLKILVLPLVLAILIASILVTKYQASPENTPGAVQEIGDLIDDSGETVLEPELENARSARSIPPGTSGDPPEEMKSSPPNTSHSSEAHEPDAHELIEFAGQGEIDAGFEFLRKFEKCKDFEVLKEKTDALAALVEKAAEDAGVLVPESVSKMSWENRAKDEYAECQHFLGGENGEIDKAVDQVISRLRSGADGGNAFLRFLYSMWGPSDAASIKMVSGVSEYERLAREYTSMNLEDNAGLALLALGISYSEGKYFTPMRLPLGRTYLWAAGLCGVEQSIIDRQLGKYANLLSVSAQYGQTVVIDELLVQETALEIAAAVCPVQK